MTERHDPAAVGRDLAAALGDGPDQRRRLAQRERLVRAAAPEQSRVWLPWVVALAAVVIAIVGTAAWVRPRNPNTTSASREDSLAHSGRWLEASPTGAVQLALDEGTWVRIVEGGRARVATPTRGSGRIALESGRVEAEVEPSAARSWTVEAGPYEVTVVGTVFSVDWDAAASRLEVEVVRGKVVVTGESIGSESIAVEAGHRLQADHARRSVTLEPRDNAGEELVVLLEEPPPADPEEKVRADVPLERAKRRPSRRQAPPQATWKSEATAGNYTAAMTLAKRRGVDGLLASLTGSDLILLADTARLARDRGLARRAYVRVRERFKGSKQAARAAFQLGRLAADGAKQHTQAAQYFSTYLEEAPRGAYAREARGRLVQSLDAAGDSKAASNAARKYLKLHPKGPHARLSRSLAEAP
ncbi:MAG: FecR domain-containing protein [Nannocystales bacterium]